LRLVPALFVLLLTTVLVVQVFSINPVNGSSPLPAAIPFAAFYLSNWIRIWYPASLGTLAITWSLAVEEQFYVIWPLLLVFLLRRGIRARRLLAIVLSGAAVSTLLRVLLLATGSNALRIFCGSDTRADALLLGCALGIMLQNEQVTVGRCVRLAAPVGCIAWIGAVTFSPTIIDGLDNRLDYGYLPVFTLTALAGTLLIGGLVLTHGTWMHRIFAFPVLTWLGKRSYGIYLWHVTVYTFVPTFGLTSYTRQMFLILAPLVPVILSYQLIERPALRLKSRLRPSGVPPSPPAPLPSPAIRPL
jgi:peptidoglycan/LPS O-acetylase OafA/YrhL